MKFTSILWNVAIPIISILLLFRTDTRLGLAGTALYAAYAIIRGLTSFYAFTGNFHYQRGSVSEAFKWFDKAVARKDTRPAHLIGYGFLQLKHGDTDRAEELLLRAGRMKVSRDEKMSLESNMGLLLWKQGRLQEATAKMESLYAEYKNSIVYGTLGYFYILSGDLGRALAFNQEAYEFNETGAVILDNLGQTYLLRGEYGEALTLYEKLDDLNPSFPEAYYNHGLVLAGLGRRAEALKQLTKALDYPVSLLSTVTREEIEAKIAWLEAPSAAAEKTGS